MPPHPGLATQTGQLSTRDQFPKHDAIADADHQEDEDIPGLAGDSSENENPGPRKYYGRTSDDESKPKHADRFGGVALGRIGEMIVDDDIIRL